MKECWFCGSQQYTDAPCVCRRIPQEKHTGFVVCMGCHLLSPDGVHVNQGA